MEGFLQLVDPNQNGIAKAMDPNENGFMQKMDPAQNGVKNWWDGAFNRESINQQNTVLKGMFSTNKNDKEQGRQAMLDSSPDENKIFDHPIGKPNNYDPIYNPDPKLPDAPTNLPDNKRPTTNTVTTYFYIGGALVILFVLLKN